MAVCRKLVEGKGAGVAFPCDLELPEGHDGPCAAKEKPATIEARKQWEKEQAVADEPEVPIEAFQTTQRAVDSMVVPESIAPYPGERGFPQDPESWQVYQDRSTGNYYAFVPIIKRWTRVHEGEVDAALRTDAPRTATVTLGNGTTEQRVILPDPQPWDPIPETESTPAPAEIGPAVKPRLAGPPAMAATTPIEADEPVIEEVRVADQPDPEEGDGDIWAEIIEDMAERREIGIQRYGTPLQRFNGRDAATDAYQEALDLLAYLRQASGEREIIKAMFARIYPTIWKEFQHTELEPDVRALAEVLGVVEPEGA